jgi:serine/threonine protein kinase
VAIKKITDVFDDLTDAKRILREMKLLRHLGVHENIINVRRRQTSVLLPTHALTMVSLSQILDVILVPPNVMDFSDIYIVTDLMESDLERIISSSQPLSDAHFQYFLYQILRGVKFIHSGNVLHRDLKPSNLLVNSNCDLSICDFGLARGVEVAHNEDLTEYVVTRWYRAPELLTDCPNYNDAVDVWAIGCIFAEMLRRRPFFTGRDPADQLHAIIRVLGSPTEEEMSFVPHEAARKAILQHGYYPKVGCDHSGLCLWVLAVLSNCPYDRIQRPLSEFFPDANALAIDLLAKMLKFNPDERITVLQALAHPYLSQLHNPVRRSPHLSDMAANSLLTLRAVRRTSPCAPSPSTLTLSASRWTWASRCPRRSCSASSSASASRCTSWTRSRCSRRATGGPPRPLEAIGDHGWPREASTRTGVVLYFPQKQRIK